MEPALIDYLLHVAPSLAVALVLLWRMEQRLNNVESIIHKLLDDCWQRVLEKSQRD